MRRAQSLVFFSLCRSQYYTVDLELSMYFFQLIRRVLYPDLLSPLTREHRSLSPCILPITHCDFLRLLSKCVQSSLSSMFTQSGLGDRHLSMILRSSNFVSSCLWRKPLSFDLVMANDDASKNTSPLARQQAPDIPPAPVSCPIISRQNELNRSSAVF